MAKLKICFIGNNSVDWCTEVHLERSLRALGHNTTHIQEDRNTTDSALDIIRGESPDIVFYSHSHGLSILEVFDECAKMGIPTVAFHLDLFLGIPGREPTPGEGYWKIKHFFTVDKLMADYLNWHSDLPNGYFLPPGVLEEECYMGEPFPDLNHDVIFVGSKGYHPQWPTRPTTVTWLENTYGSRFARYGNDGARIPGSEWDQVRGNNLNRLLASTKIVVGDSFCPDFKYPYYHTDRLPEITGRGGFIIFPYIKGLEDEFILHGPDQELVTYEYGNYDQLKYLIDYYLENDDQREVIRKRGYIRAKTDHNYTRRMATLLRELAKREPQLVEKI